MDPQNGKSYLSTLYIGVWPCPSNEPLESIIRHFVTRPLVSISWPSPVRPGSPASLAQPGPPGLPGLEDPACVSSGLCEPQPEPESGSADLGTPPQKKKRFPESGIFPDL